MKIAFYKAKGGFANKLIRWWTKSEFSHVELVFGHDDGAVCWSSSAQDGGVRFKRIDFNNGNWVVLDIPWVHDGQRSWNEILRWCSERVGLSYGYKDIAKFVLPFLRSKGHQWFCSEACLTALQAHWYLLGHRPDKTSPVKLYELVVAENAKYSGDTSGDTSG